MCTAVCTQSPLLSRLSSAYPPWAILHPSVYSILLGLFSTLQSISPPWSFLHPPVFETPLSSLPIFFGKPPPSNQKILLGCPPIHLSSSLYTKNTIQSFIPPLTIIHHPICQPLLVILHPPLSILLRPSQALHFINYPWAIPHPPGYQAVNPPWVLTHPPGCQSSLGYPPLPPIFKSSYGNPPPSSLSVFLWLSFPLLHSMNPPPPSESFDFRRITLSI